MLSFSKLTSIKKGLLLILVFRLHALAEESDGNDQIYLSIADPTKDATK